MLEALRVEQRQLDALLSPLHPEDWSEASRCPGWSIADVVLHLAQTDEAVESTARRRPLASGIEIVPGPSVDEVMNRWVEQERGDYPPVLFARWRQASAAALSALASVPPDHRLDWIAGTLKPDTLATTRLAEYWAHALDIAQPLGLRYRSTDRLWHVCWLAHRSLPYAFSRAGRSDVPIVRLNLIAPSGEEWCFGPSDAACRISGAAYDFALLATRRVSVRDADMTAEGDGVDEVLQLVRTYA